MVTLDADNVTVNVSLVLESYAIHSIGGRTLFLAFNDEYVTLDAPALSYDGGEKIETPFGSHSFNLRLPAGSSASIPLVVEWHFGGYYGKDAEGNPLPVPVLECGGNIEIIR